MLGALFAYGQAAICGFVINSRPVLVCKRARRCRTVQGYATKTKTFVGWQVHLVCTTGSLPVAFTLLPGGWCGRTPNHELTVEVPERAWVYGDKACNSDPDEMVIRASGDGLLVPLHKGNMVLNRCAE